MTTAVSCSRKVSVRLVTPSHQQTPEASGAGEWCKEKPRGIISATYRTRLHNESHNSSLAPRMLIILASIFIIRKLKYYTPGQKPACVSSRCSGRLTTCTLITENTLLHELFTPGPRTSRQPVIFSPDATLCERAGGLLDVLLLRQWFCSKMWSVKINLSNVIEVINAEIWDFFKGELSGIQLGEWLVGMGPCVWKVKPPILQ